MEIPNLLGLKLYEALDFLEKTYPELCSVVVRYCSPISTKHKEKMICEERIVRQRILDSNKIELVVSSFYDFQTIA